MNTQAYIQDLLARGMAQEDCARLAQVSPSFVSQLMKMDAFVHGMEQKRAAYLEERGDRAGKVQAIHDNYLELEQKTLHTLSRDVDHMRPGDRVKLLSVLAGKKEPAPMLAENTAMQGQAGGAKINVQIVLPARVAQKFVLDSQKRIIGMDDGTVFAPMTTRQLQQEAGILSAGVKALDKPKQEFLPARAEREARVPESVPQVQTSQEIMGLFDLQAEDFLAEKQAA